MSLAGAIVGVAVSHRTGVSDAERERADRVSIESGDDYLEFDGGPGDAAPDVVENRSGKKISDVWVEAVTAGGSMVNIDMAGVRRCRWEQIGGQDAQGRLVHDARVVHFTLAGEKWRKTVDEKLERDDDPRPPLVNVGDKDQATLAC